MQILNILCTILPVTWQVHHTKTQVAVHHISYLPLVEMTTLSSFGTSLLPQVFSWILYFLALLWCQWVAAGDILSYSDNFEDTLSLVDSSTVRNCVMHVAGFEFNRQQTFKAVL